MAETHIQWAEKVWNPLCGCTIVSPGCAHCYAMRMAYRLKLMGHKAYQDVVELRNGNPVWTGKVNLVPEKLDEPLRWRKPCGGAVTPTELLFPDGLR